MWFEVIAMAKSSTEMRNVWDPLVRIFHWSLLATVTVAYLSEPDWFDLHIWAGFIVTGLILFRLLWGFVGTEHARFKDFVFGPGAVFKDLKNFLSGHPARYIGHSPAGGAMVLVLLGALTAVALSGLELYAVEEHSGPFVSFQSSIVSAIGNQAESKYYWRDVHGLIVNCTLLLAIVHVVCVLVCSVLLRENMPLAMITGRKHEDV
jgi:cytochrome b